MAGNGEPRLNLEWERERRYLQETIEAMRVRLESSQLAHAAALQEAVAQVSGENRQLQATISALREGMEQLKAAESGKLQETVAAHAAECQQLRETIIELRSLLEAGHAHLP